MIPRYRRANASSVWNYATGGQIDSSPTVADGLVYVGCHDGKIYALNASTGMVGYNSELHNSVVWSYSTGNMVMFSSPAIAPKRENFLRPPEETALLFSFLLFSLNPAKLC